MRALALIAVLLPVAAEASAPDVFGFGARGFTLGNTLTATAADFEAVYYNPAGLGFSKRPSVALGVQSGHFFLNIDGARTDTETAPAITVGLSVPLPLRGVLSERLVLGVGFVLPQTAVLVADLDRPGVPRYVRIGARPQTVSIMGAAAVRITDQLSVGAGFLALAELVGSIDVAPNASGEIGSTVVDDLLADYSMIVGVHYAPLDWLTLGLVYRGQSDADFNLPIETDLGEDFPLPVPTLDIRGTAQFDPAEVTLAAAARVAAGLTVSGAVTWERWSTYPNPLVFTAVPDDYPAQPPPDFSDVVTFAASAQWQRRLGAWRVIPRGGIRIEPSPVPEQSGFHNYLDSTRLALALGSGVERWGLRLDTGVQLSWMAPRSSDKTQLQPGLQNEVTDRIQHDGVFVAWSTELGARF